MIFKRPACVPNPDLTYTEPCRRLLLVGFVCLPLACLPVYRTLPVNVIDCTVPLSLSRAIEFCYLSIVTKGITRRVKNITYSHIDPMLLKTGTFSEGLTQPMCSMTLYRNGDYVM